VQVFPGKSGGRPDALKPGCLTGFPDPSHEHRHVRPLAPAVRVQLIEHQEAQSTRSLHQFPLKRPGQDELQHDVVRQEYVGGICDDCLPLLIRLLSGVGAEPHRAASVWEPDFQELVKLARLAVHQCVHGVDDDSPDFSPTRTLLQHGVHDGDQVGETLPGAGAAGQHVAGASLSYPNGVRLVLVQPQPTPDWIARALDSENLAAGLVQDPSFHRFVNRLGQLEARVELDKGVRPKKALLELLFHYLADALVADGQEAPDEVAVLVHEAIPEAKHVHGTYSPNTPWPTTAGCPRSGSGTRSTRRIAKPQEAVFGPSDTGLLPHLPQTLIAPR
jgi:hypothetical protein